MDIGCFTMHQSQIFHKDIYRQIRFRERFKISERSCLFLGFCYEN